MSAVANMSGDDLATLFLLSMGLTMIIAPEALIVWLLLRALHRSRARDAEHPSPRGFDIVEAKQSV